MKKLYIKPPTISKALFLDIDGVLNRAEYGKDLYNETYSDYCVCLHRPSIEALKHLLDQVPSLKVVWITDWAKDSQYRLPIGSASPLAVLESFDWLHERVVGSIFCGTFYNAQGDDKMLAIKNYIDKNLVDSYAILDDYAYAKNPSNAETLNHHIAVNPLKSFLEDDIERVSSALSLPTDKDFIHDVLWSMSSQMTFMVNGMYACRKTGQFGQWTKDINCPRVVAAVDVDVEDSNSGEKLVGRIELSVDKDLNNHKEAVLYVKHEGAAGWESSRVIVSLNGFK